MSRPLKYLTAALLWAAVAGYIIWSAAAAHRQRAAREVTRLVVDVHDSTSQGHLVSTAQVRSWIGRSGLKTVGAKVGEVDLRGIERLIADNGFVSRVDAYVRYDGTLHVDIRQRRPLLRMLTDGWNSYVTQEGFAFAAPRSSSLYVPVVTGSYRPPFPASYSGPVRDYVDGRIEEIDRRIEELEREKYPYFRRELQNDENIRALRRMRIKRRWWRFESEKEFEERVEKLRSHKADLRRSYRYEARLVQEGIEAVATRQEAERRKQKKLEKSYEDFTKLLTFVEFLEEDDFWRSEVVQIVAHTAPSGALEVELIPRSGRFRILFGRIERVDEKFDLLADFYRRGLGRLGWDEFATVSVQYRGRVVCRK